MAKHKTFFGKVFGSLWDFIKDAFKKADHAFLETVIDVTNKVKDALNNGIVDFLTGITTTTADEKIVALLRDKVAKIVASELLVKLSTDTDITEEEAQQNAKKIIDLWGGLSDEDKAEFYTKLAAKLYIFLQEHVHGEKVTFGQAAAFVESAYQAYLKLKEKDV